MSLKSSNQVIPTAANSSSRLLLMSLRMRLRRYLRERARKSRCRASVRARRRVLFIEKYYGEQVFYEDAINMVYPSALEEAVKEAGIRMIEDRVDFDLLESGKGKDLVFKVVVTTYPEVSIEGYRGIEVTKKSAEVTDDDVDAELARVQDRNSRMVRWKTALLKPATRWKSTLRALWMARLLKAARQRTSTWSWVPASSSPVSRIRSWATTPAMSSM